MYIVYLTTYNAYDHCPTKWKIPSQKLVSLDTYCTMQCNFVFLFFSDGLVVSHLPFGPTAYFTLSNTVMRHDIPKIGTMSEAYPHLIFHNFNSKLGERVSCKLVISVIFPKNYSVATYVHRKFQKTMRLSIFVNR